MSTAVKTTKHKNDLRSGINAKRAAKPDVSYFENACNEVIAQALLYGEAHDYTFVETEEPSIWQNLVEQAKILLEYTEQLSKNINDENKLADLQTRMEFLRQIIAGKLSLPQPSTSFDNLLLEIRKAPPVERVVNPMLHDKAMDVLSEGKELLAKQESLKDSLNHYLNKNDYADDGIRRDQAQSLLSKFEQQRIWLDKGIINGLDKGMSRYEEFNILLKKAYSALEAGDFPIAMSIYQQMLIVPEWQKYLKSQPQNVQQVSDLYNAMVNTQAKTLKEISANYFLQIDLNSLYTSQKNPDAEYVNKLINHVQESILGKSSLALRIIQTEYWVWVANQCYLTGDFCSCKAILAGLRTSSIYNLKSMNANLSTQAQSRLTELERLTGSEQSSKQLRRAVGDHQQAVPFLGIYLTDLEFLKVGNPNIKLSNNAIAQKLVRMLKSKQEQLQESYSQSLSPAATEFKDTLDKIIVSKDHTDELYKLSQQNQSYDDKNINQHRSLIDSLHTRELLVPNNAWLTLIKNDYLKKCLLQKNCYVNEANTQRLNVVNKILSRPSSLSDVKLNKALQDFAGVSLSQQEITALQQETFKAMLHPLLAKFVQGKTLKSQVKDISIESRITEINKAVEEVNITPIKTFFAEQDIILPINDDQLEKLLLYQKAIDAKLDRLDVYLPKKDEMHKSLQDNYKQTFGNLDMASNKLTNRLSQLDGLIQKIAHVLEDEALLNITTSNSAQEVYDQLITERGKVENKLGSCQELQSIANEYLVIELSKSEQEIKSINSHVLQLRDRLLADDQPHDISKQNLISLKTKVAGLKQRVDDHLLPVENKKIQELKETVSDTQRIVEEAINFAKFNRDRPHLYKEIIEHLIKYQQQPDDEENFVQLCMKTKFTARGNKGVDDLQEQLEDYLAQNLPRMKYLASMLLPKQIAELTCENMQHAIFELLDSLENTARDNPNIDDENVYYMTAFLQGIGSKLEHDFISQINHLQSEVAKTETAIMDHFHKLITQTLHGTNAMRLENYEQLLQQLTDLNAGVIEHLDNINENSVLFDIRNDLLTRIDNKFKLLENFLRPKALTSDLNKLLANPPSTIHLREKLQQITQVKFSDQEAADIKQVAFHAMIENEKLAEALQGHTLKSRHSHSKNIFSYKSTHKCIENLNEAVRKQDLNQVTRWLNGLNVDISHDQLQKELGSMDLVKGGTRSMASLLGLTSASVAVTAATLGTGIGVAVLGALATAVATGGISYLSQHRSRTTPLTKFGLFAEKHVSETPSEETQQETQQPQQTPVIQSNVSLV